jgi:hypothetical protein
MSEKGGCPACESDMREQTGGIGRFRRAVEWLIVLAGNKFWVRCQWIRERILAENRFSHF